MSPSFFSTSCMVESHGGLQTVCLRTWRRIWAVCKELLRVDFSGVNQFTITGTKKPWRPDLVCFVNRLPLGLIELKNPADQQADVWKAFDQLQTYQAEISDLLVFNEALDKRRDERAGGIADGEQGVVHAVADDFQRERQAAGGI